MFVSEITSLSYKLLFELDLLVMVKALSKTILSKTMFVSEITSLSYKLLFELDLLVMVKALSKTIPQ